MNRAPSRPRRLIVLRHAKSSWSSGVSGDHARPLNPRGLRDAPRVAERLAEMGWVPNAVYCSDAMRTRETWALMEDTLGGTVTYLESFYGATLETVRSACDGWDNDHGAVLVIGHNPGWEEMVTALTGVEVTMTTCNAALLSGNGMSWAEAMMAPWTLTSLIRPKEL